MKTAPLNPVPRNRQGWRVAVSDIDDRYAARLKAEPAKFVSNVRSIRASSEPSDSR